jgi:hypothetical protein
MCESVNGDPVLLVRLLAVLPLRLFAAYHQAQLGMFVRNSTDLTTMLSALECNENTYCRLLPLFLAVQMCLGLSVDKNEFLTKVASLFGSSKKDLKLKHVLIFILHLGSV